MLPKVAAWRLGDKLMWRIHAPSFPTRTFASLPDKWKGIWDILSSISPNGDVVRRCTANPLTSWRLCGWGLAGWDSFQWYRYHVGRGGMEQLKAMVEIIAAPITASVCLHFVTRVWHPGSFNDTQLLSQNHTGAVTEKVFPHLALARRLTLLVSFRCRPCYLHAGLCNPESKLPHGTLHGTTI